MKRFLRHIPSVHQLQQDERFQIHNEEISKKQITKWLQEEIELIREKMLKEQWYGEEPSKEKITTQVFERMQIHIQEFQQYQLRKVINATGTILHTNLGRARLSDEAISQVVQVAQNYSNLEYKLNEGKRGSRHDHIEDILKEVTGAEAAMVVNNNAAAVYLVLRALAKEKEVIVSRGELVEIGGSFRVSAIMEESGADLIEIGTTNKTHEHDYQQAINENTSMIMKVHTSNFKVIGFTKEVNTKELVNISHENELIYYEDLGSGVLHDFNQYGIGEEPVVSKVIEQGADLVSFSGDKLLGGPQAGIIVGKKQYIDLLKKHQLARVLRVDKMTLAALEATLKSYITEDIKGIPTIRDMLIDPQMIANRAKKFIEQVLNEKMTFEIREDTSQIGGGTMPEVLLPTFVVQVTHELLSAEQLAIQLRKSSPAVIGRIKNEKLHFDFRTISDEECSSLVNVIQQL